MSCDVREFANSRETREKHVQGYKVCVYLVVLVTACQAGEEVEGGGGGGGGGRVDDVVGGATLRGGASAVVAAISF